MDLGVPDKCRCMSSFWSPAEELVCCSLKFSIRSMSSSCFSLVRRQLPPRGSRSVANCRGALLSPFPCLFPAQQHGVVGLHGTSSFLKSVPNKVSLNLFRILPQYTSLYWELPDTELLRRSGSRVPSRSYSHPLRDLLPRGVSLLRNAENRLMLWWYFDCITPAHQKQAAYCELEDSMSQGRD